MGKYEPLAEFLNARDAEAIPTTFAEIERVIGSPLPPSKTYPAWWSNNPSNNVMTRVWLAAGYRTEQVDTARGTLVFRRVAPSGRSVGRSGSAAAVPARPGRHPLIGVLKGRITIATDADLTEPADPEWGCAV